MLGVLENLECDQWEPRADGEYVSEEMRLQKSLSKHRASTLPGCQIGEVTLKKKSNTNAQHFPLPARTRGVTFTGRALFRAPLHKEFQVTASTVNNTKIHRGELIPLPKHIPLDGHGGHLQTPMYGNVLCAPNATRRPAIQRPAT